MAIPKHDEIRVPVLELLNNAGTLPLKAFLNPLAQHFKLSEAEVLRFWVGHAG